jgi:hypothetical protein
MSEVILSHYLVGYTSPTTLTVCISQRTAPGERSKGVGENENAAMSAHFDVENYIT